MTVCVCVCVCFTILYVCLLKDFGPWWRLGTSDWIMASRSLQGDCASSRLLHGRTDGVESGLQRKPCQDVSILHLLICVWWWA